MAPHDQDPNKIDVSLNIMSDATLAAVNNLTTQLASLREFIAAQSATDPAAQATGVGRAAGLWLPPSVQAGIHHGPSQPIQAADPSNPSQGAQASAERNRQLRAEYDSYINALQQGAAPPSGELSPQAEEYVSRHLSDRKRWQMAGLEKKSGVIGSRMDRFFQLYPGVQRDPREDTTYDQVAGSEFNTSPLPAGMGFGGGSYPPQGPPTTSGMGGMGDMPGWAQALNREGINPEARYGLTIPRLGEFTIQDKLNMAAQWMGRAAMRREEGGNTGRATSAMGRTAAGAAYLRDQSAAIVEIGREFQRVREFARGEELGGEALGFSRESALGDAELFGVGARLNLGVTSAAQREAMRQEITQRRVQAAPGVSGEEAQRVRQMVAGMGYSGEVNERLQYDLFRPITQRYGAAASEAFGPLVDQGIRQGNSSIGELRDVMIDLADAARQAHMTVSDVAEASLEYAESMQSIGASYDDALRGAATFTRAGLDPRLASQAMQSPFVQGFATMQTGLPPGMQGIIDPAGQGAAMSAAARTALAMGQPFANMPDRGFTSASGERITTVTGEDARLAFASQTSGMPRQLLERFERNPNFLETGLQAQTMAQQLEENIRAKTNVERTETVADWENVKRDPFGRPVPGQRKVTTTEHRDLTGEDRRRLTSQTRGITDYADVEAQMLAMDPTNKDWTARVRKISKDHANVEDRIKVATRIIGETTSTKPEPDYLVGLTNEARKILKIERPKDREGALPRANAGGAPANAGLTGPNFPSSTGGAMSYGIPGGP